MIFFTVQCMNTGFTTANIMTALGLFVLLWYGMSVLFTFYGIDASVYGVYFLFYAFLVLTVLLYSSFPA